MTRALNVETPSDPLAIEEYLIMHHGQVAYRVLAYPAALEMEAGEHPDILPAPGPRLVTD